MKKLMLVGLPALCLFVVAPMLVAVVMVTLVGQAGSCLQRTSTQPNAHPGTQMNSQTTVGVDAGADLGLAATQWKRASQVVSTGMAMGMSDQGIVVALAVANQESDFTVYANDGRGGDLAPDQHGISRSLHLPHDAVGTDHGSLGVFQQQWPWWGSMEQLMDPAASARKFFEALVKVPGWESLPLTVAAQAVQGSAHPGAYADDEDLARQIYAKLTDTAATDLYLASTDLAECATQNVAAGGSVAVFPVPSNLADTDQHNWGEAGTRWDSWHTGTDFSVPCGTPVLASHPGTIEIDTTQAWAGPQLVKVSVGPGQLTTWYGHMQKVMVADRQPVTAGQQIGEVGDLGNASGCHLHFEVHTEGGSIYGPDNVDPSTWLAENVGKTVGGASTGGGPGSFVIATFNALGESHTQPGGNKPGWADSATRTRWMADLLTSQGPDVVGLQEFQAPQARVFGEVTGDTWASFGNKDNVIIWRRDTFELESTDTVAIPYFGGQTRQMPLVRLRRIVAAKGSDQFVSVLNVHNPADARGPAAQWRAEAIARERTVIAQERAAGHPVFLVGDLNDRQQAFCPMTSGGLTVSASGGTNAGTNTGSGGAGCEPPNDMNIDWIFGTGVVFSNYLVDTSPQGNTSDHPYVEAVATPVAVG